MKSYSKKSASAENKEKTVKNWPRRAVKSQEEPHFLFIITPRFSGAAALVHLLNSSRGSMLLHKRGEGQWLIPGMREDRWNREKQVDWQSVRTVWLQRVMLVKSLVQSVDVIIEQSPPNMVRMDGLTKTFPNHTLLTFNRNPFASCVGSLRSRGDIVTISADERLKIIKNSADGWMERSRLIREWAHKDGVLNSTYEIFCADPVHLVDQLAETIPSLKTVEFDAQAGFTDAGKQRLQNFNKRMISKLSASEVEAISEILSTDRELLSFFGYGIDLAD